MKKAIGVIGLVGAVGATVFGVSKDKKNKKEIEKEKDFSKKIGLYYHLLNKWLKLKQQGKSLADYFAKNEIKTVAIYGYKELGERLYDELKDSGIEVKYIIDKNVSKVCTEVDVYSPDEELPKVDAIIVTATYFYDEIESELYDVVKCPIISLEDIVVDIMD